VVAALPLAVSIATSLFEFPQYPGKPNVCFHRIHTSGSTVKRRLPQKKILIFFAMPTRKAVDKSRVV